MTVKENSWQGVVRRHLYPIYERSPGRLKNLFRNAYNYAHSPLVSKKGRWLRDEYTSFCSEERRRIFLGIAQFANVNRPIDGYYLEFGSHGANTMRMAWDVFRHLFDWDYVAFDSFEGLPDIESIDKQEIWGTGRLKTEEADFINICVRHGMPRERLRTVRGFYGDTLTAALRAEFAGKKAAVVYIDCDLYKSTVPVLEFIRDMLQPGTILVFDDWNCFLGDPLRGERKAWGEFCETYPDLRFESFVSTSMQQAFIYLGTNSELPAPID